MTDEGRLARLLDAALTLCIHQGSAAVADVAAAVGIAEAEAGAALAQLARRGDLLPRPGNLYARPLRRRVRLPGESFPTEIRAPITALMGLR